MKLIGHRKVSPGILKSSNILLDDIKGHLKHMKFKDVVQFDTTTTDQKFLQVFSEFCTDYDTKQINILGFNDVPVHQDYWNQYKYKYAPVFLHQVIHGKATIKAGSKIIEVAKGDVFWHYANRNHAVTSKTLCVTLVTTTATKFLKEAK